MKLLEGQARLDTKLVDEDSPSFLVGLERFRLSVGAIENEHQLTAQPLPKGVLSDERLDLANERRAAPELDFSLDPLLECLEAALLEASDLTLRKGVVGEIGERRAPPELEGFPHQLRALLRFAYRANFRSSPRSGGRRSAPSRRPVHSRGCA